MAGCTFLISKCLCYINWKTITLDWSAPKLEMYALSTETKKWSNILNWNYWGPLRPSAGTCAGQCLPRVVDTNVCVYMCVSFLTWFASWSWRHWKTNSISSYLVELPDTPFFFFFPSCFFPPPPSQFPSSTQLVSWFSLITRENAPKPYQGFRMCYQHSYFVSPNNVFLA